MHHASKFHVEWLDIKTGKVRYRSFNTRGEQRHFAYRLNSPGVRLTFN